MKTRLITLQADIGGWQDIAYGLDLYELERLCKKLVPREYRAVAIESTPMGLVTEVVLKRWTN